ncbi:hypothetical protein L0337_41290 [candidate division KSB1 bacterium]|nr:hypothetical protein [candidate division KSB1 bacterium]
MSLFKILPGPVLLLLLCAWANYSCPYPDLAEILGNPQKFAGQRVAVFIEARIAERTEDGFILAQRGHRLRVLANVKEAPLGEFVAVQGVFQPPNHLRAETIRLAQGRRWKIAISVIPVLLLAVLLPMALRFDRRNGTLTLRAYTGVSKILQRKGNGN